MYTQISENFHNVERPFTTESQFVDAQSNTVPGSDQQSCTNIQKPTLYSRIKC